MAIDGTWNIVMKTPIGDQQATLTLATNGQSLQGTMSSSTMGSTPLRDGATDGNSASWKADISQPMSMTLEFTVSVDGDSITGNAKLGMFGNAPFTGMRT
ncbi:MAG TPA: hypothetical protein VKZ79_05765 [Alphaproteobacteria bacterium]|nr:hypothetical protein [Alphaproteobacteria bacterium]